jgi:hypothetical protein
MYVYGGVWRRNTLFLVRRRGGVVRRKGREERARM